MLRVRDLGDGVLVGVHVFLAAFVDGTHAVAEDDVAAAHAVNEVRDGLASGTCAVEDELRLLELAARELEGVNEGRDDDDGRAVLVVVEDRDIEFLQALLDVKALRCLDVLEVDAAECRCHELDGADDLIDVLRVEADGDGVYTGKALEEDGLAFHDRQAGASADVAEAEYSAAVRHDGDRVALVGVVIDLVVVLLNLQAWRSDARRVGQRQVLRLLEGDLAVHLDLAVVFSMQGQCLVVQFAHGEDFLSRFLYSRLCPALVGIKAGWRLDRI